MQDAAAPVVRPIGGHTSGASSPDHSQPPGPPNASGSLQDLQDQLRETQSSLASHKEKVRTLEEVLTEQEILKQDVKYLKEFMEERRRDLEMRVVEERMSHDLDHDQIQRGRSFDRGEPERERREGRMVHDGFDLEDDDELHDTLDDEDDTRSIATAMPHSLERVDEEDEDNLDSEQVDEPESVRPLEDDMSPFTSSASDESLAANVEVEEEERRREDLNVRRPGTPEPLMGLVPSARRTSLSSPLQLPPSDHNNVTDDIYEQVIRLSKQLSSVIQVTKTLEAQHHDAQDTIRGLENKVASLEHMLQSAEEALANAQASPKKVEEVELTPEVEEARESKAVLEGKHYSSLVDMMAEWKKSVEGQWSSVREEWVDERERLAKARDEFESQIRQVDNGLERVATLQTTLLSQQQQFQAQFQQQQQQISALNISHTLSHPFHHHNGDAIKHYGGLVTPPSPRSRSSESGRFRRRRRRSSGSRGEGRAMSSSPILLHKHEGEEHDDGVAEDDADTDTTLASLGEDDLEGKAGSHSLDEPKPSATEGPASRSILHGAQLATPASSVGSLEGDVTSQIRSKGGVIALVSTRSNSEDMASLTLLFDTLRRALLILVSCVPFIATGDRIKQTSTTSSSNHPPLINVQTAAGVVLLSIAAAAVFWKVKPE